MRSHYIIHYITRKVRRLVAQILLDMKTQNYVTLPFNLPFSIVKKISAFDLMEKFSHGTHCQYPSRRNFLTG